MTIISYPLDAISGSPTYTGQMLRDTLSALCGAAPSGRPLGAVSGVRPGTPTTTVTATSTTWTVGPHAGILDVETPATAGPYLYAVTVNETGGVNAADATNPRIDLISIQISDPAESDGSSVPAPAVVYTAGTAASSPTAPATPARAIPIAQINVPNSGGGAPSVTWVGTAWNRAVRSYHVNTSGPSIPTSVQTTVTGWVPVDVAGMGAYTAGVRTIAVDGIYAIVVGIAFPALGSPVGQRAAILLVNSTQVDVDRGDPSTVHATTLSVACTLPLYAGDTVTVQAYQSQGTAQSLTTTDGENHWSITRVGTI